MSLHLYKNIIRQAAGYKRTFNTVNLFWLGEPLLHPQIGEMISFAKEEGFRVNIVSNGELLTQSSIDKIIAAGIDAINISHDGYDYHKELGRPEYPAVLTHCRNLRDAIRKSGREIHTCLLSLAFPGHNIEEYYKELIKVLDGLTTLPLGVQAGGEYLDHGKMMNVGSLSPEMVPCGDGRQLTVAWNGMVTHCCGDYDLKTQVGDFNTERMETILERYLEWLAPKLDDKTNLPGCRDCAWLHRRPYAEV